jgi:predicted dehydrogenase
MSSELLRIGIVGASPTGSWGTYAHIPALSGLPDFQITAVCNARLDTATSTSQRCGARHSFDDPRRLAECPDVDAVAVCVRVPRHAAIVEAALQAGKHVYCEWPLARDVAEASKLLELAREKRVTHMVGLQARQSPVLRHVRRLLDDGAIGAIHACSLTHSVPWFFGPDPQGSYAYLLDRSSGAHFLSIPGGHSIDALCHLVGEFQTLSAVVEKVTFGVGDAATAGQTSANQILVSGVLTNGAVANIRLQGAPAPGTGVRLEINGSKGDLLVTSAAGARGIQMADLQLFRTVGVGELQRVELPEDAWQVPTALRSGPALNVSRAYLEFRAAITQGRPASPDFAAALARHQTLDCIELAADEGRRVELAA